MKQINNFPNVDKFEYILSITRSSKDFDRIESIIEYNNNFYLHTDCMDYYNNEEINNINGMLCQ